MYVLTLPTLNRLFRNHVIEGDLLKLIHELALAKEKDVYEFLVEYARDNLNYGIIHYDIQGILNSCHILASQKSMCIRSFGQLVEKWNQCSKLNSFVYADDTGGCVGDVFVNSKQLLQWLQHNRDVSRFCLGFHVTNKKTIQEVKQYGYLQKSNQLSAIFYVCVPSSTRYYGYDNDKDGSGIVYLIACRDDDVVSSFMFNNTPCISVRDMRNILPLGFIVIK